MKRTPRKFSWGLVAATAIIITLGTASVTDAAPAIRQTTDVFRVDGGTNEGTATLTRTNSGVSMRMSTTVGGQLFDLPFDTSGLDASWEVGDASTNWFVLFNYPGYCTDPCGEDDVIAAIFDPAGEGGPAGASVHYAAGHVAGSSSWHSAGSLREGDTSGMLFGLPLQDALTAEVHVVARSHGPMATIPPGERGYALNSVDGGCGTNTCGDAQAAIFPTPD